MRQFFAGSDDAFASLEHRARSACVVFNDQELPPVSIPSRSRVGFEVDPVSGSAFLFVQRGVEYGGANPSVREWLYEGTKHFADFATLRRWLQENLAPCYVTAHELEVVPLPPIEPAQLTNLDAVQAGVNGDDRRAFLDDEALMAELTRHVRGQGEALQTLSRRVSRHVARARPRRPLTVFAIGPTGVGKTKTAESLPVVLKTLDARRAGYGYLRLDMSEYQERHRVSQLLGAPQGYVGYSDGAQLVDVLAANARTIVLFDEIEKAHPNVLRALMNAIDAGHLSSAMATAAGREIDCRDAIFFFTSNLDAAGILQELETREGFADSTIVDAVVRDHLRAAGLAPELVGRIGCFLVFRPLTAATRAEIATLAIARVGEEYGLRIVHVDPMLVLEILHRGSGSDLGARPDEFLVDEVLGAAFTRAAAARIAEPVAVLSGPPIVCVPWEEVVATPARPMA